MTFYSSTKTTLFLAIIFILLLHLVLLLNLRFTVWPEMMLYPWLLQNGFDLYKNIINPYFPLLPYLLKWFMDLFGFSILSLKIVSYFVFLLTDIVIIICVLKITKRIEKTILILVLYIFLQILFGGNGLWFDHVIAPLLIASTMLVYFNQRTKTVFFAGLLLTFAVFIKQNAAIFCIPALYLLTKNYQSKKIIPYFYSLIFGILCLFFFLLLKNGLWDFFEWAVFLPITYAHQPGFVIFPTIRQFALLFFLLVPVLFAPKKNILFWILCFAASLYFAFPRYEDFHLQVFISFLAIFLSFLEVRLLVFYIIVVGLLTLKVQYPLWRGEDRFVDLQTIQLANEIRNFQSVYLINSPELAYFFANKVPPRIWSSNFPWYFESDNLQQKVSDELEKEKTEYIIIGKPTGGKKFDLGNYRPEKVLEYVYKSYTKIEEVNGLEVWKRKH